MFSQSFISGAAAFFVIFLIFEVPCKVNAIEGQSIGSVYQCAHDFRGEVFVKNEREITIKGLNYDGKGPAAWFHGQLKGAKGVSSDKDFMTLPYPNESCARLKVGRRYTDEDVSLILPVSIKEFETIGIFCYQYCHNFGHIVIPENLTVTEAPADLVKTEGCPKPEYSSCTKAKTRNSDIKPDCTAGASHMNMNMVNMVMANGGLIAVAILTSAVISSWN